MAGGMSLGRAEDERAMRSAYGQWSTGPDPDVGYIEQGFDNTVGAAYGGVKHGLDVAAAFTADALTDPLKAITPDFMDEWLDDARRGAHEDMVASRADPRSMGTMGQMVHAVTSVITEGTLGAIPGNVVAGPLGAKTGAVASIGTLTAYDKYEELIDSGVDESTALKVAGITGTVMGVGAALPAFIGKTLSTRITSGIGLNVGLGFVDRGGSGAVLENAGYEEMASHYQMLDGTAMLIDATLGAAFPIGHKVISLRTMDTAMDANKGVVSQLRDPALQNTYEGVDAKAAADIEISRQILEEGRTPENLEIPRGVMDDTTPNPAVAENTSRVIRAMDELFGDGDGTASKTIETDIDNISRIYAEVINENSVAKDMPVKDAEGVPSDKIDEEAFLDDVMSQRMGEALERDPNRQVVDEDGTVKNAADVMNKADETFLESETEVSLYKVAIACAIGGMS